MLWITVLTLFIPAVSTKNRKPNIVFLLTDDQDVKLGGQVRYSTSMIISIRVYAVNDFHKAHRSHSQIIKYLRKKTLPVFHSILSKIAMYATICTCHD